MLKAIKFMPIKSGLWTPFSQKWLLQSRFHFYLTRSHMYVHKCLTYTLLFMLPYYLLKSKVQLALPVFEYVLSVFLMTKFDRGSTLSNSSSSCLVSIKQYKAISETNFWMTETQMIITMKNASSSSILRLGRGSLPCRIQAAVVRQSSQYCIFLELVWSYLNRTKSIMHAIIYLVRPASSLIADCDSDLKAGKTSFLAKDSA